MNNLLSILENPATANLQLNRSSLTEQTTDLLREQIILGRIPPGTKMVERELAQALDISRMPAREALMILEHEGLVVAKSSGRYIIQPTLHDIEHLYQVRIVLESLAARLAASRSSPESCRTLRANLQKMHKAIVHSDRTAYVRNDLEAHTLIWAQADNPHLQKMLYSITGPIFLFIATHTDFQKDWTETWQLHDELTTAICSGDPEQAELSMRRQLENSLQLSQSVFRSEGSD